MIELQAPGGINQTAIGGLSGAAVWASSTGGSVNLSVAAGGNATGILAGSAYSGFLYKSSNPIALMNVDGHSGISTTMSGNIILDGQGFSNSLATPFTVAGGGRWLVYAASPANVSKGSLTSNFRHYNGTFANYAPVSVTESGNGFIYASAPGALTVSTTLASGTAKHTFGTTPTAVFGYTIANSSTADSEDLALITSIPASTLTFSPLLSSTTAAGPHTITYSSGLTSAAGYTFTPGIGLAYTVDPAPLTLVTAALNGTISKVYDGKVTATLLPGNFKLTGFVGPDGANVTKATGSYASRNVGSGILVTTTLAAGDFSPVGATLLSNYILPTTAEGNIGTITQLASVAWIGGTDTKWSTAANWAGGALPDRANVASVTLGNGPVTYDYANGALDTPVLKSLNLASGTLTVPGGVLTVPTWIQSGGNLRGAGGLTVTESMIMTGLGTVDVGGPVSINHSGDLKLGRIKTAGDLSVTATGTLSGTNAAGTWVHTAKSITLDANGIGAPDDLFQIATGDLTVTNRSGDAWIYNSGQLNLSGSSAGRLHLENLGGLTTGSTLVSAGGQLDLIAKGPITIGTGGVEGGTGVLLRADGQDGNSGILINGPVSSPGGAVKVYAVDDITQNADITGTDVSVGSTWGNILMAATAQTRASAGNIDYRAPAGNMVLARLEASSGSVSLDAGGSITTAPGFVGNNITARSAFIKAGGDLELSTNVTLLDVDVGGSFRVTNGDTVFAGTPSNTTNNTANEATRDLNNITNNNTPGNNTSPRLENTGNDPNKPPGDQNNTTGGGTPDTYGGDGNGQEEDEGNNRPNRSSNAARTAKKDDDKPVAKRVAQCKF